MTLVLVLRGYRHSFSVLGLNVVITTIVRICTFDVTIVMRFALFAVCARWLQLKSCLILAFNVESITIVSICTFCQE